jgi:transposase InsO family protein
MLDTTKRGQRWRKWIRPDKRASVPQSFAGPRRSRNLRCIHLQWNTNHMSVSSPSRTSGNCQFNHICGVPEVLYTDNGADFTSKHLEQVAADFKMRLVFSIPGKPQVRGRIERFFRTVNEMFLCDLDGFTRRSRKKPSLNLGQFEDLFRTFLLEVYHRRASSSQTRAFRMLGARRFSPADARVPRAVRSSSHT